MPAQVAHNEHPESKHPQSQEHNPKDQDHKDKDSKDSPKDKEAAARKAAHDKVPKPEEKTESNKDRWESIDKTNKDLEAQHELIDKAPLIMPSQNPPPGYPRVEVLP